jgi:hypothetical protein
LAGTGIINFPKGGDDRLRATGEEIIAQP